MSVKIYITILIAAVLALFGCVCYVLCSSVDRAYEIVGAIDNDIYSVEIYDDGKVEVTTDQRYINQIDEHTFIITDKDFDEVEKALMDMQDLGGE